MDSSEELPKELPRKELCVLLGLHESAIRYATERGHLKYRIGPYRHKIYDVATAKEYFTDPDRYSKAPSTADSYYVTGREAAVIMGVTPDSVRTLANKGKIEAHRDGDGDRRYVRASAVAYREARDREREERILKKLSPPPKPVKIKVAAEKPKDAPKEADPVELAKTTLFEVGYHSVGRKMNIREAMREIWFMDRAVSEKMARCVLRHEKSLPCGCEFCREPHRTA